MQPHQQTYPETQEERSTLHCASQLFSPSSHTQFEAHEFETRRDQQDQTDSVVSVSPLGICLSVGDQAKRHIIEQQLNTEGLCDAIVREIIERSASLKHRRVAFVDWRIPPHLIAPEEITQILYFLAKSFFLEPGQNGYHLLTLSTQELDTEIIALFKGLGFHRLQVYAGDSAKFSPSDLRTTAKLVREFQLDSYQLLLDQPYSSLPSLFELALEDPKLWPETVTLIAKDDSKSALDFAAFYEAMRSNHYRVLGNDCFTRPDSDLAKSQNLMRTRHTILGYNDNNVTEILGLGPGAVSQWRAHYQINPSALENYCSNDINRTTKWFKTPLGMAKCIYDDLLCFHRLDIDYYRKRYDIDLVDSVSRFWSPIQSTSEISLYHCSSREISLTQQGIAQLGMLGKALFDGISATPSN